MSLIKHYNYIICLPFCLWFLLLVWLAKDHAFFWDTVQLASKQAHWYYDNNFQHFFLPEETDSGHPPFFGMALAALWSVFGRALWVGHIAMLPFLFGIVFLGYRIGLYFFDEKEGKPILIKQIAKYRLLPNKSGTKNQKLKTNNATVWLLLLLAADPFILGQSVLVSPDIIVLFSWLLGIFAILYQRPTWKILAALILAMISLRGMMLVLVLFLFDVFRHWSFKKITIHWMWQKMLPYVPSGLFAVGFLWAHYQHAGWVGYHNDSPWAPSFAKTDFEGSLRNIGLLIWRLVDFGRVGLCVCLGIIGLIWWRKVKLDQKGKELLWLCGLAVLVLTPTLVLHQHLSAHRYLIPITTLLSFMVIYALAKLVENVFWRQLVFTFVFLMLLTGNAWVYPKKIAQGWDSTLAHWPYYTLRDDMLAYIKVAKIPLEQIGTAFPNVSDLRYLELKEGAGGMRSFDLENQQYIFYSNIYNDFSDMAINELENNWIVKKRMDRRGICVILYEKE